MNRFPISVFVVAAIVLSLLITASPAGDKESPWKRFLPEDVFRVLSERSFKTMDEASKAKNKAKLDVEAAIQRGYTLSVDRKAGNPKKGNPETEAELKAELKRKEFFADMMKIYRNKAKGGEGIHDELQYQPKLKNQNGIESLIGALAAKKLSDDNLAKVEKELPLLSYRIAVTASLTQYAAPEKGKERWNALAVEMRESALALAESAHKKNADGILMAADALQNSCTQCHREFKAK
jgi:hypothetical protein